MGVMEPVNDRKEPLTRDEVARYSRHLIIPTFGVEAQQRLKAARVLCVGAGGLGSPTLMYLAAAGVGTIGIIDFDLVDLSNLQRQIIHGESDLGRPKAESARDSVKEINPLVDVELHQERLERSNVMSIFESYDIIIDGTDNFATRYLINDAAVLLNKPVVWGSIYRFDGQASVFWSEAGPCYRCLFPEPPPPGMVPSCAEGGVLGVLCASIGAIQSTETIKLITGIGEPLIGRLMIYDALAMSYRTLEVRKDPHCPICSATPTQVGLLEDYELFCGLQSQGAIQASKSASISAQQLKTMMDSGDEFVLIDVREPSEFEIVSIPGAQLIPKDRILNGNALAELPHDRPIVLYCKSGVRSAETLAVLLGAGFKDARHLADGVVGWVKEIDTQLPLY